MTNFPILTDELSQVYSITVQRPQSLPESWWWNTCTFSKGIQNGLSENQTPDCQIDSPASLTTWSPYHLLWPCANTCITTAKYQYTMAEYQYLHSNCQVSVGYTVTWVLVLALQLLVPKLSEDLVYIEGSWVDNNDIANKLTVSKTHLCT